MRVLSYQQGAWAETEIEKGTDIQAQIERDELTWVRAGGLSGKALDALGRDFGLHPLALEDVRTARQRPKVEDYDDLTFVIARVPRYADHELDWQQVGLFLGDDFLITASTLPVPELDNLQRRLLGKGLLAGRSTVGDLLHAALDCLVDSWFPFMDALEDHTEELEDSAAEDPNPATLRQIRHMKQTCSRTRKVAGPMRDATLSLERSSHPNIAAETQVYLRDVSDHMVRIAERLEHVREMALIAQETWNSTLANQQNQVMKRLTVIAGLLLFPTLVAGIGGMNFEADFPAWNFWHVTLAILVFIAVGLALAAWRRWL